MKFYVCKHCGNVITKCVDSKVPVQCCGENMTEMVPNTTDAAGEKHVPVVTMVDENVMKVKVGEVPHPSTEAHHISFICVETETGCLMRNLDPLAPAEAEFTLGKEKAVQVLEYCNLHGLWATKL